MQPGRGRGAPKSGEEQNPRIPLRSIRATGQRTGRDLRLLQDLMEKVLHLLPGRLVGRLVIGQGEIEFLAELIRAGIGEAVLRAGIGDHFVVRIGGVHLLPELLDLFREQGISARGIDINDEMVETCRSRGLTAERADALSFLAAQPDASLGGLIAIQVVEHLDAQYLMRLTESAYHKLKPGATLVFETVNTACWAAFFDSYIRDFTHVHPLHPDTLRYLVQASGFSSADLRFLSPIADHDKLPVVKILDERDVNPTVRELVEAVNGHASRLNSQLFTYRDYAVIAKR